MGKLHRSCPNLSCIFSRECSQRFYSRNGSFHCKWSHRNVPRYRCRGCGKSFSTSTFRSIYWQKKPYLKQAIFDLYSSGTSQRRLAKLLKTNRKTIARKFEWLARWARREHLSQLRQFENSTHVQLDEMESFEHTRLKPLSLCMAVEPDKAKLIDIQVGTLNYKGRLANFAFSKYGFRKDTSEDACLRVLEGIRNCGIKEVEITTDGKNSYPKLIKKILPEARHSAVKIQKISMVQRLFRKGRRNENDPLFVLNYMAAKIRHDLSRMARKVWVTTKKASCLQAHLDLYMAYVNGYVLPR